MALPTGACASQLMGGTQDSQDFVVFKSSEVDLGKILPNIVSPETNLQSKH